MRKINWKLRIIYFIVAMLLASPIALMIGKPSAGFVVGALFGCMSQIIAGEFEKL